MARRIRLMGPNAALCAMALACVAPTIARASEAPQARFANSVRASFRGVTGAAVVLRVHDSSIVAAHNLPVLKNKVLAPGSTIKPFTLELLLRNRLVSPSERIACRRGTSVRGVGLNCSHGETFRPLGAAEALAFSCNTYFVETARRLPPGAIEAHLAQLGFASPTGLSGGESEGRILRGRTVEERQLLAIGAVGLEVTPLELAAAYVRLARWRKAPTAAQQVVLDGLTGATSYGLAQLAQAKGVRVAGKTGTASTRGNQHTHAWFAGFAPADDPQIVVVVYVERGRGSVEAATVARRIFEAWAGTR